MAIGIEEAWKRLSLTAEEEIVIECKEEETLYQRILTYKCNEDGLEECLETLKRGYYRGSRQESIHLSILFRYKQRLHLNEEPRAFDDNILLLRTITGFEQPSKVQFTNARFWVKAIDVPPIKQTLTFAKVLVDNLGRFVGCNESCLFCAVDKSVNFQVDVDITKPLRRGLRVMVRGSLFGYLTSMLNYSSFVMDVID